MRICIFGAGAIGGFVAAHLAQVSGLEVSVVARGEHLAAIRARGLRVRSPSGELHAQVRATDRPEELGPQDLVFIALKQHQVTPALPGLAALLGPETAVVPPTTGIPYWYFHGLRGPHEGHRIERLDPGGAQWQMLGPQRSPPRWSSPASSTTTASCCAFPSANPMAAPARGCRGWPTR